MVGGEKRKEREGDEDAADLEEGLMKLVALEEGSMELKQSMEGSMEGSMEEHDDPTLQVLCLLSIALCLGLFCVFCVILSCSLMQLLTYFFVVLFQDWGGYDMAHRWGRGRWRAQPAPQRPA